MLSEEFENALSASERPQDYALGYEHTAARSGHQLVI